MRPAIKKMQDFHLRLTNDLFEQLRAESEKVGIPATVLAREALSTWLHARNRLRLRNELTAYAAAEAGSSYDLDLGLEAAGIEALPDDIQIDIKSGTTDE